MKLYDLEKNVLLSDYAEAGERVSVLRGLQIVSLGVVVKKTLCIAHAS
jgi:hypothetical protein